MGCLIGLCEIQNSFTDYRVGIDRAGKYKIVLNSDRKEYGGWGRIDESVRFFTTDMPWNGRSNFTQIYRKFSQGEDAVALYQY